MEVGDVRHYDCMRVWSKSIVWYKVYDRDNLGSILVGGAITNLLYK